MGCCLVALASFIGPRFALFLTWIFSERLTFAFTSFWYGFLGFLIVPWTTLFYALAYAPIGGVGGIGWLFVAFGVFLDISTYSGGQRSRSKRAEA